MVFVFSISSHSAGSESEQSYDLFCIFCLFPFSLMHDDVLDEAATRRGRPAAHSVFGNKKAILGGDFILARA